MEKLDKKEYEEWLDTKSLRNLIGTEVIIMDLKAEGRVVAIVVSEYGVRYEVRYFWEGVPHQEFFFGNELIFKERSNEL